MIDKIQDLAYFERGPVRRVAFSNGSVFLHHRPKSQRTATFYLWFLVGSRQEKTETEGLCHLIEHMLFKTRCPQTGKRYAQLIEHAGGELNAYTTKEYLCFQLSSHVKKLPDLIDPFLNMLLASNFNHHDLREEKKVVIQEIREDNDSNEYVIEERMFENLFSRPLGHPIGGSLTSVRALDAKKLNQFRRRYLTPERLVICMVADVTADLYTNKIQKVFERLGQAQQKAAIRPKMLRGLGHVEFCRKRFKRHSELSYLQFGAVGSPIDGKMRMPLTLLDLWLTDGMSSELFLKLREEKGHVYGLSSQVICFTDNGCYSLQMSCHPSKREQVKQTVLQTLEEIALYSIESSRLEKIKNSVIDYWDMLLDDVEYRNDHLARGELYRQRFLSLQEMTDMVREVEPKDIAKMASIILDNGVSIFEIIPKR